MTEQYNPLVEEVDLTLLPDELQGGVQEALPGEAPGIQERVQQLYNSAVSHIKGNLLGVGLSLVAAGAAVGGVALNEAPSAIAKTTKHHKVAPKSPKITSMLPFTLINDVNKMNNNVNGGSGGLDADEIRSIPTFNYNGYTIFPICKAGHVGASKYVNTLTDQITYPCAWTHIAFEDTKPRPNTLPDNYFEPYLVKFGAQALNSAKKYFKKSIVTDIGDATNMSLTQKTAHIFYESIAEEDDNTVTSTTSTGTTSTGTTTFSPPTSQYELTLTLSSNNKTDKLPKLVTLP